ncbi:MAG TPA: SDR family oxidoreductase [Candidatus Angelobacter sp.]|nr:SDR family oxidoreductase [Candidatus Angelobacter sp.]
MQRIQGAVAVVTGAGSGIGRALAQELAKHGAQLALADVHTAGLQETLGLLGTAKAKTYQVDVSEASQVQGFAEQVARDFGGAALLVNNAGVALHGTFAELSLADMEWLIKINFWGVIYGCKFFMPLLQASSDAHIVNVSSVFGMIGPPGQAAYCSSKFAVRGFTEVLRHELQETHIKVTCVHPGGIRTSIAARAREGEGVEKGSSAPIAAQFEKLPLTSSEKAAQVIVKGILGNKARVLIGSDAKQIDLLQRLMPVRATGMVLRSLFKGVGKS